MPPENELMKGSELETTAAELCIEQSEKGDSISPECSMVLRVRESLQRINVPKWMKKIPQEGFLLRRNDYGSTSFIRGGWTGLSSRSSSMMSLRSPKSPNLSTLRKEPIPIKETTDTVGTDETDGPIVTASVTKPPILPSPIESRRSRYQYPVSSWSSSGVNSGTTTPSTLNTSRTSLTYSRTPYLGWRSQSSLANLTASQYSINNTGKSYLTPTERLASSLTTQSYNETPTKSIQEVNETHM